MAGVLILLTTDLAHLHVDMSPSDEHFLDVVELR
jgi:hypothetical protein